ncbi:hypothetical protein [Erythrobacter sp. SG61-1L]|uniref:hypothetical protein n=1 Tax=Erythrobacter sp. SG61-1L TaxID=1603897 RepID=UPI0006C8E770|nr:hypothetical protein [Erythrobacter sp. SG61-1L]
MKKPLLLAAAAAALVASVAPAAQAAGAEGAATPAPTKLTPEQAADIQRAAIIFRLFNTAFTSKEVEQPVKTRMLTCLYGNSLGKISVATGKVMKEQGLDDKKPGDIYRAAAGVCGISFKANAQPAAKPSGEGR